MYLKTNIMKNFTFLLKDKKSASLKTAKIHLGLILTFCFILFTNYGYTQESTFYKLPNNESEIKSLLLKDSKIDSEKVFDLIHKLPPMIYVENNKIQMVTETNPIVLVLLDVRSFDFLHDKNLLYNKVEMITIHINQLNDLSIKMDFSKISGFDELKYIYIQCIVECTENQIKSMIVNSNPKNIVLFKVITPA